MAQLHWNYTNDLGRRYVIGLYHGPQSGHFIAYCNSAVIIIDFNVKASKSYSFFIENELCEIKIEQQNNGFTYDFDVNRDNKADQDESADELKNYGKWIGIGAIGLGILVLLYVAFTQLFKQTTQYYSPAEKIGLLAKEGQTDWAKIYINSSNPDEFTINFSVQHKGRSHRYEETFSSIEALPFPVISGDEFKLNFLPNQPEIYQINLDQPSTQTVARLKRTLVDQYVDSDTNQLSESMAACSIDYVTDKFGMEGLAFLFHRDTPESVNESFNSNTYTDFFYKNNLQYELQNHCSDQ